MIDDTKTQALKEFRRNLADVLKPIHTDTCLMKWLRAKNFNLSKAELLFRQHLATRDTYQIDTICDYYEEPEVIAKYQFAGFLGQAKDGSPIRYSCIGRGDFIGFIKSMSVFMTGKYCSHIVESDLKALEKYKNMTGKSVEGVTYIFDMEGLSFHQLANRSVLETGLDLMRMVQDHYPEVWRIVVCVNAPFIFDKVFNLFKPVLRTTLMEKIQIISRERTPAELLKRIDADVLPVFLGGDRTDCNGDPMCKEFITFGGKIPEEYYLVNKPQLQESDPGVEVLWVPARSIHNHTLVVEEAGSTIHIEMRTDTYGLVLSGVYKKFGPNACRYKLPASNEYLDENDKTSGVELISPPARINGHIAPVDAFTYCVRPGLYIFRFDNTYSWFYSIKAVIRLRVVPPKTRLIEEFRNSGN